MKIWTMRLTLITAIVGLWATLGCAVELPRVRLPAVKPSAGLVPLGPKGAPAGVHPVRGKAITGSETSQSLLAPNSLEQAELNFAHLLDKFKEAAHGDPKLAASLFQQMRPEHIDRVVTGMLGFYLRDLSPEDMVEAKELALNKIERNLLTLNNPNDLGKWARKPVYWAAMDWLKRRNRRAELAYGDLDLVVGNGGAAVYAMSSEGGRVSVGQVSSDYVTISSVTPCEAMVANEEFTLWENRSIELRLLLNKIPLPRDRALLRALHFEDLSKGERKQRFEEIVQGYDMKASSARAAVSAANAQFMRLVYQWRNGSEASLPAPEE